MSGDQLAAIGAFLSGVGSVVTAGWYLRRARKRFEEECERRFKAFQEGMRAQREAGKKP